MKAKCGHLGWPEAASRTRAPWRKELPSDFARALAETKLPERPDYEKASEFLIRARKQQAKGT